MYIAGQGGEKYQEKRHTWNDATSVVAAGGHVNHVGVVF
jgi:hypothetical protein